MAKGEATWNGPSVNDIEIDIDIDVIAKALASNPEFIRLISGKVRNDLTKDARLMGNLFGKWAGR
jgi:hypothetical protein